MKRKGHTDRFWFGSVVPLFDKNGAKVQKLKVVWKSRPSFWSLLSILDKMHHNVRTDENQTGVLTDNGAVYFIILIYFVLSWKELHNLTVFSWKQNKDRFTIMRSNKKQAQFLTSAYAVLSPDLVTSVCKLISRESQKVVSIVWPECQPTRPLIFCF